MSTIFYMASATFKKTIIQEAAKRQKTRSQQCIVEIDLQESINREAGVSRIMSKKHWYWPWRTSRKTAEWHVTEASSYTNNPYRAILARNATHCYAIFKLCEQTTQSTVTLTDKDIVAIRLGIYTEDEQSPENGPTT